MPRIWYGKAAIKGGVIRHLQLGDRMDTLNYNIVERDDAGNVVEWDDCLLIEFTHPTEEDLWAVDILPKLSIVDGILTLGES